MKDLVDTLIEMGFSVTVGSRTRRGTVVGIWIEIMDDFGNSIFLTKDMNDRRAVMLFTESSISD